MEKDRKVVKLTSEHLTDASHYVNAQVSNSAMFPGFDSAKHIKNHLSTPISPLSRYLWEPIHRVVSWIKSVLKWVSVCLILMFAGVGIYSCFLGYSYYRGYITFYLLKDGEYDYYSHQIQIEPKNENSKKPSR